MTHVSKRFLLLLIIVVLAIVVLIAVNSVYFNRIPIPNTSTAPTDDNAVITIQSPQNGSTYNVTSLPLYFNGSEQ